MNEFFDELSSAFAEAASKRGAHIESPRLDAKLAEELLGLASVVAHSRERRFAPLACYLAGVAAARAESVSPKPINVTELVKEIRIRYTPQEESQKGAG